MKSKMYKFTIKTISQETGIPEWRVRRDARSGKFDPSSLISLSLYVAREYLRSVRGI
jgi:hypothetical protein